MSNDTPQQPRRRRKHRPRPTPKWLLEEHELDQVARRRCLMLLSVLSGEKAVTDAIAEAEISRQMYYQLEEKALQAMIRALTPGTDDAAGKATSGASRMVELEQRVTKLEREKRRAERLLLLTRKTMQPGGLKVKPGRPRVRWPKPRPSTSSGSGASSSPPTKPSSKPENPSTPTKDGEAAP